MLTVTIVFQTGNGKAAALAYERCATTENPEFDRTLAFIPSFNYDARSAVRETLAFCCGLR